MNIIRHRYIFFSFSGILVLASIAALAVWGLRLGIDFTGGSLLEAEFSDARPPAEEIRAALEPLALGNVVAQPTGERGIILRFRDVDEAEHQEIIGALSDLPVPSSRFIEKRFDAIGPVIGAELYRRAIGAIVLAIGAIILYIAWAFRHISKPVASWKYGVAAVAALLHDIAIPVGVFAALGRFQAVEVDILFITALLTVLGFSVHDTIVVFDRIRENLRKLKKPEPYAETVNRSINQTLTRSLLTSLTVLLALAVVFFFGGASTQFFTLTLIIGISAGTYSSIFVASPLLVFWESLTKKR